MVSNRTTHTNNPTTPNAIVPGDEQRSLGELFSSLTNDLTTLMRQEVHLARTETGEKISAATGSVVRMAAGGMVAYAGVIGLLIAVIVWLADFMPFWLSALIVGGIVLIIGLIMLQSGRSQLQHFDPMPQATITSIQKDAHLVKEKVS